MRINLTGHHMDITASLRNFVETKFERLERHFDNMTNIHVILAVEKDRQKAEATIKVNRGRLFAEAKHEDMYAAIDNLVDKLDRCLASMSHSNSNSTNKGSWMVSTMILNIWNIVPTG